LKGRNDPLRNRALSVTKIPIVTHILPAEFDAVYVVPLSDEQIGDPGFDEQLFVGYREWILERENAYCLFPGDMFENPMHGQKASNVFDMHLTPSKAMTKAKELIQPLADAGRILGAVDGNHEFRTMAISDYSPLERVLSECGLPTSGNESIYDPEAMVIRIAFGQNKSAGGPKDYRRFVYKIYMSHGWGGARRTGAHVNKTEELAAVVTNADVYIIGHEHTLYCSRWDSAVVPDNLRSTNCQQVRQLFIGGGTFCRYTKFQKRVQRRLPNLGAPRIRLEGVSGHRAHKDIHVGI
jgi:hypothetical protein